MAGYGSRMGKATGLGRVVRLPADATGRLTVYVNGEEQAEGADYAREDGRLVFARDLRWAKRTGLFGWAVMATAGVGFYEDTDVIDVHWVDGRGAPGTASGLRVEPV